MADSFHLTSKARGELANKIKEEIVGWLRGRKRGSDTAAGADSKRQRLDSSGKKEQAAKPSGGGKKAGGGRGGGGHGKGRGGVPGRKPVN
jgi:hypothetical protein